MADHLDHLMAHHMDIPMDIPMDRPMDNPMDNLILWTTRAVDPVSFLLDLADQTHPWDSGRHLVTNLNQCQSAPSPGSRPRRENPAKITMPAPGCLHQLVLLPHDHRQAVVIV